MNRDVQRRKRIPAEVSALQGSIFHSELRRPTPSDVRRLAQRLLRSKRLAQFRVLLVGSVLTRPQGARDVDLLLCRRSSKRLSVLEVGRALLAARTTGLEIGISVDPCFRNTTVDKLGGRLLPKRRVVTWKLEDPILSIAMAMGIEKRFRRAPGGLVVTSRLAREFNYYRRLPWRTSDSGISARWLEPGVPLERLVAKQPRQMRARSTARSPSSHR